MINQDYLMKYQDNYAIYQEKESLYKNPSTDIELPYGNKTVPSIDEGNVLIKNMLEAGNPFMLGRFGETELRVMMYGLTNKFPIYNPLRCRKILQRECANWCEGAGFFPRRANMIPQFTEIFEESCKYLDILAVWYNLYEDFISDTYAPQAQICRFQTLNSFFEFPRDNPWTEGLKGKKVLVISPFAETIMKQYQYRDKIYSNPRTLPEFKLQTIKAVESPLVTGKKNGFKNWFEALDWMYRQTEKLDYDVAILGCGAYGFPLAAKIKQSGHMAIQLCGQTQILFGIKGRRWEIENPELIKKFANEYWTRPSKDELPKNRRCVEEGCYW